MTEALVYVELRDRALKRAALEAACSLEKLGCKVCAVALSSRKEEGEVAAHLALSTFAFAEIFILLSPSFESYDAFSWTRQFCRFLKDSEACGRQFHLVVAAASGRGTELLAGASALLGRGFCADCIDLKVSEGGKVSVRKPFFGGKAHATVEMLGSPPFFVTIRQGTFPAEPASAGDKHNVKISFIMLPEADTQPRTKVVCRYTGTQRDVSEAEVVVCGGRGLGASQNFNLVEKLAHALGGTPAASRAVVDAGWRDLSEQVGKSGKTISANLYVGVGVSGAIHHRMGMDLCKNIVVINSDRQAEFFKHADVGIVGNLFEIVPALIDELTK